MIAVNSAFPRRVDFAGLVRALRDVPPAARSESEMKGLIGRLCEAGVPLTGRLVARDGGYTRTCVYQDETFEVLLLNWSPGASSPVHDHGGQRCWLGVISGELFVDDYERCDDGLRDGRAVIIPSGAGKLGEGGIDARGGRYDIHRVGAGWERAVSVHVYARPLHSFHVYEEFDQRCRVVRGQFDAHLSLTGGAVTP